MNSTYQDPEWLKRQLKFLEEEHQAQKAFYRAKKKMYNDFLAKCPKDQ